MENVVLMTEAQVTETVADTCTKLGAAGKTVLVVIPDATRTCPLPLVGRLLREGLRSAKKLDFLIALGTHVAMDDDAIAHLVGCDMQQFKSLYGDCTFFNHDWKNKEALEVIGTLSADQIRDISGGLFEMKVDVDINKKVLEYDKVLICGPVFPHEVVGYSGGAKYFFPGVCGPDLVNFFHWLGAVITCPKIIGNKYTPVRKCLHAALDMVKADCSALCMVVVKHELAGLFYGSVRDAWSQAVDLSSQLHVKYCDHAYKSVLSQAPPMYDELWVGAKAMYKMEPVVADNGELIIYAPHIKDISATHGTKILELGYHTRDYFLKQWDQFKDQPWGILAHLTHVKGIGNFEEGWEKPRITVTLACGIPEETCRKLNLGYRDPATIDVSQWASGDADKLYVPQAGEMLFKLKNPPAWQCSDY